MKENIILILTSLVEITVMISGLFGLYHLYTKYDFITAAAVLTIAGATAIAWRKE